MNSSGICGICLYACAAICLAWCCIAAGDPLVAEIAPSPAVCAVPAAGATEAACCAEAAIVAVAVAEKPWVGAALRNALDPLNGDQTSSDFYLPYADEAGGVYARVYFSSQESVAKAGAEDLKQLYLRAYLAQPDGTTAKYGTTRLSVKNSMCPVSGVGATTQAKRNPLLEFHAVLSVNCTAGSCAVGDGYTVNYNAIQMNTCCPSCAKAFGEAPEKHIRNVWSDVEAALYPDLNATT